MPLLSETEVKRLKLSSILLEDLRELANTAKVNPKGNTTDLIKILINIPEDRIDAFIKGKYERKVNERRKDITDKELVIELNKVARFEWGVIQGQLDQKIQTEYVRKFYRYEQLLSAIKDNLYGDVKYYVICSWYNHWTTVLIEDHISQHPRVIPTLKDIKGVDIFFDGQPFDLKVTYLSDDISLKQAVNNPQGIAIWNYEHQGAQRFGSDNRLYVILVNKTNRDESWKLKREFDFVYNKIDDFLHKETVSKYDEITFSFKHKTYTAVSKVLLIMK